MKVTYKGQIYPNYKRSINELAQTILLDYSKKIDKPIELPIPIFDIAERLLYLKYDIENMGRKLELVSAITIPAKYWILLNSTQGYQRIRYSLAHEIVHCLVEKPADMNWPGRHWFLRLLYSPNASERERVADYFASALLMPRSLIVEYSKQFNLSDQKDIKSLAHLFDISLKAMAIRLEEVDKLAGDYIDLDKELLAAHSRRETGVLRMLKPRYILVKPPQSVFDHRFILHVQRAAKNGQRIYFLLNQNQLENLDLLLQLNYGDGFVFFRDSSKQLAVRLAELDEAELLDFEYHDQYYKIFCYNTQRSGIKDAMFAYAVDREGEVSNKELEIGSVSSYIEPITPLPTRTDARKFIRSCQAEGKKVVIVTGCFDLITHDHVTFLQQAKAAGDVLIVGVENDRRVKAFKGALRPTNTESQRLTVLNALRAVDFAFIIHGSPRNDVKKFYTRLHESLGANILAVTEGDPHIDDRREEIESGGGKLVVIPMEQQSGATTTILQKFLAETEFSDLIFIKKQTLYQWTRADSEEWKQLRLPLEVEEAVFIPGITKKTTGGNLL